MTRKSKARPFVLLSNIMFALSLGFAIVFLVLYLLVPSSNAVSISFGVIASSAMVIFLIVYFLFGIKKPNWVLETEIVQYILNVVLLVLVSFIFALGFIFAGLGSATNSSSSASEEADVLIGASGYFLFFLFSMVAYLLLHLILLIVTGVSLGEKAYPVFFRVFYILNEVAATILVISLFILFAEAGASSNPLPYLYLSIALSDLGTSFSFEEAIRKKALCTAEEPVQK